MNNEFIYNPANFNGHSHCATIAEFNDSIYLSWYAYEEQEHVKGQIALAKYNRRNKNWSESKLIFDSLKQTSCGNPTLFTYKETLHMYFVVLSHYWDSAIVYYSFLKEDESWSEPQKTNLKAGVMPRHRPVIFNDKLLLPAYDEKTMHTQIFNTATDLTTLELYSEIKDKAIQGDILFKDQNTLQIFLRAAGDYNHVLSSTSYDLGRSWRNLKQTSLFCPLSGIAALKLKSNTIIVAHNHTPMHKRNPLSISVSTDGGLSFKEKVWNIDAGQDMELSYPTLLQDHEHYIHLAYTYNRKMIKHSIFTEKELLEKVES